MSILRWEPTPYRGNTHDEIADLPNRLGRYRIRPARGKRFRVEHNGKTVALVNSRIEAMQRAERGAAALISGVSNA